MPRRAISRQRRMNGVGMVWAAGVWFLLLALPLGAASAEAGKKSSLASDIVRRQIASGPEVKSTADVRCRRGLRRMRSVVYLRLMEDGQKIHAIVSNIICSTHGTVQLPRRCVVTDDKSALMMRHRDFPGDAVHCSGAAVPKQINSRGAVLMWQSGWRPPAAVANTRSVKSRDGGCVLKAPQLADAAIGVELEESAAGCFTCWS